ncbi:MAG: GNAT family N-acetyltransferase [Spirochaetales bacterium]|nr:GNAT family N-acetyltransferase [Spirochaetales bacterium]
MQVNYRKAELKDIDHMVRLLGVLFSVEEDFDFRPEVHSRALERIITSAGGEQLVLVAEDLSTGEVVAMLTVQTVVSTATGELSGWVEDVVVDPRCQGEGLGTGMLARTEEWARSAGINRLQLLADRDNDPALGFYKSRGWTGSNMIHRKKMIPSQ